MPWKTLRTHTWFFFYRAFCLSKFREKNPRISSPAWKLIRELSPSVGAEKLVFEKKKSKLKVVATTWMSRWKLGSKVRISELQHQYTRFISRWNNPVILTIDPNFQHDLPHLIWQKYPIIYRVLIHPNSGCLGFLNHQTVWKASTVWCKPFL